MQSLPEASRILGPLPEPYFAALPGYFDRLLFSEQRIFDSTAHLGNRVHFSGLGGDELLGGVQNPIPDLARLLWHLSLPIFFERITAWALQRKTTVWSLAGRSMLALTPIWVRTLFDRDSTRHAASWLRPDFVRAQHISRRRQSIVQNWRDWLPGPPAPDSGYLSFAATIAGHLPRFSFAEISALPYYDRDLVEFLLRIPGDQVLRAHQRRSLMRRALKDIVPSLVLSRKTKWIGHRRPTLQILDNATALCTLLKHTPLSRRYLDPARIEADFAKLQQGKDAPVLLLERVLGTCILYRTLDQRERWRTMADAQSGPDELSDIQPANRLPTSTTESIRL